MTVARLIMISKWKATNNNKHYKNKTGVINDPLGQTHSLASSEHCFHFKFVLIC